MFRPCLGCFGQLNELSKLFRHPSRFKTYLFVFVSYVSQLHSATLDTRIFYQPSRYSFTDAIA